MSDVGEAKGNLEKLAREAHECIEALKNTDLMVYIDENDDARQLVNFTAPNLARAVLEQTQEIEELRQENDSHRAALIEDAMEEIRAGGDKSMNAEQMRERNAEIFQQAMAEVEAEEAKEKALRMLRERLRQMEEALFKLRNLIFVLEDSATDMGADYLVDTEKYERLLDAAREPESSAEAGSGDV